VVQQVLRAFHPFSSFVNVFVVFRFVHVAGVMARVRQFDEARHHPCQIGSICAVSVVWISQDVGLEEEDQVCMFFRRLG